MKMSLYTFFNRIGLIFFNSALSSIAFFCFFALITVSCELIEYSPVDVSLQKNERNLTAAHVQRIMAVPPKDTLQFILISDTQRFYSDTEDFVEHANKLKDISFVILTGDITDFGLLKEFRWINNILSKLHVPYLTVIGNHDLVANGEKVYQEMYGPLNYTFNYGRNRFVFINTNSVEYPDKSAPDLKWLRAQLRNSEQYDHAIIISHIPPFDRDFDRGKESQLAALLGEHPKVHLSLNGHQHDYSEQVYYNDGVNYVIPGSVEKRTFMVFKLWKDGYSSERHYF